MTVTKIVQRNVSKVVLLFFVILLAACGGDGELATVDDDSEATPTPFPTPIVPEKPIYTVEQGTVVETIDFTGRVSPVLEEELFFRTDGFIDEVFVARGDEVSAGTVLAQLDIASSQSQLTSARLSLDTAEIRLEQAEQDLEDDLITEQIALDRAKLRLQQAQSTSSNVSLLSAQFQLENAQGSLQSALDNLAVAFDPGRQWELEDPRRADALLAERERAEDSLAMAEQNLILAEAEYNQAIASSQSSSLDLQSLQMDVTLAELQLEQLARGIDPLLAIEVERAQLDVVELEDQIEEAQLIAPFKGQVSSIAINPGDNASSFSTVMVLADPDDLEVTAELGTEELSQMSVGQEAIIVFRDRPEALFLGIIYQLPYPYGGGTVDASDDDTAVHITVVEETELVLGDLVNVTVILQEKEDVLWLPPAAIRTFQGRDFVVVQHDDGTQQRVDVLLGIETETQVEILQGVEAGQVVVGE